MSRYIDAEYCEAFFDRWESEVKDAEPVTIDVVQNTRTLLRDAPSIDIVRCGECIYWKNSLCQAWHRVIPKDGYCSIGERDGSTQTETQNSNLTFEKRTMRDCYNCERYETEDECIECHYEPKDECAKEYEELGLKELKELIEADRKDEPQTDWETEKRDNSLCYKCVKECDRRVLNRYTIECNQYEPKDESQTDCKTCKYGQDKHRYAHICNECGVGINNYTPQTERSE